VSMPRMGWSRRLARPVTLRSGSNLVTLWRSRTPPLHMVKIGEPIKLGADAWEITLGKSKVTKLTDRILEILRSCPYGLTAKEVADRLGATASNISSRLSKLAAYGIIIKTRGRIGHDASPSAIYGAATYSGAIYNAPIASPAATLFPPPK
jgi:Winged helix-turn-helix DNA-binding